MERTTLTLSGHIPATIIFLLWATLMNMALAQTTDDSAADEISEFVEAKVTKYARPVYPRRAQSLSHAGFVELIYMVDKNGAVFEPVIVNSTSKLFEQNAIRAVGKYKVQPASYKNRPVQSRKEIRIYFEMENHSASVGREFFHLYSKANKEFEEENPDLGIVTTMIKRMERSPFLTGYAMWHLQYVKYRFAAINGSPRDQASELNRLLLFKGYMEQGENPPSKDTIASIWRSLFINEVKSMRLVEARTAYLEYRKLVEIAPEEDQQIFDQVQEILTGVKSIRTVMKLGDRGYDTIELPKRGFAFDTDSGSVIKVKLRCQKKFAELPFQSGVEYQIPKSWGHCNVQVIGAPDSRATLLFFNPAI